MLSQFFLVENQGASKFKLSFKDNGDAEIRNKDHMIKCSHLKTQIVSKFPTNLKGLYCDLRYLNPLSSKRIL